MFTFVIGYTFSQEDAGRYFYFYSLMLTFSGLSRVGLDNLTLKTIPAMSMNKKGRDKFLSLCITIIILLSLISYILVYFLNNTKGYSNWLYTMVLPFSVIGFVAIYKQAMGQVGQGLALSGIYVQLILLLSIIMMLIFDGAASVNYLLYTFFISTFLVAMLAIRGLGLSIGFYGITSILRSAKPFMVISIISIFSVNYPVLLLANYISFEASAIYSVSFKVAGVCVFILTTVNSVLAPKFSYYNKKGMRKELIDLTQKSTRIMILAALPICATIFVYAKDILMFFSSEYATDEAKTILRILVVAQFVNVSSGSTSYLLQMTGHSSCYAKLLFLNTLIGIAAALFTAMYSDFITVIIIMGLSIISLNLFSVLLVKRRLNFWVVR